MLGPLFFLTVFERSSVEKKIFEKLLLLLREEHDPPNFISTNKNLLYQLRWLLAVSSVKMVVTALSLLIDMSVTGQESRIR